MLDNLVRQMLHCKQYENAAQRYGRTNDVESFRRKHDKIHQQVNDLASLTDTIQNVPLQRTVRLPKQPEALDVLIGSIRLGH